jgi:fumarate hydratase class II
MGTALATEICYERAAAFVKEAYQTGKAVREVAREQTGIPGERLDQLLGPLPHDLTGVSCTR